MRPETGRRRDRRRGGAGRTRTRRGRQGRGSEERGEGGWMRRWGKVAAGGDSSPSPREPTAALLSAPAPFSPTHIAAPEEGGLVGGYITQGRQGDEDGGPGGQGPRGRGERTEEERGPHGRGRHVFDGTRLACLRFFPSISARTSAVPFRKGPTMEEQVRVSAGRANGERLWPRRENAIGLAGRARRALLFFPSSHICASTHTPVLLPFPPFHYSLPPSITPPASRPAGTCTLPRPSPRPPRARRD